MPDLLFHVLLLAADGAALAWLHKRPRVRTALAALFAISALAWGMAVFFAAGKTVFIFFRLMTHGAFLHLPVLLAGAAWILLRHRPRMAGGAGLAALTVAGLAAWATWIEPYRLEVSHVAIETSELDRPVRVAVVADIQTDAFGEHEKRALRATLDAEPDLILMPGDYLQIRDPAELARQGAKLRDFLKETAFGAPLGAWAVRGDMEQAGWESLFDGTRVQAIPDRSMANPAASGIERISIALPGSRGPGLTLTALAPGASRRRHLQLPETAGFHIVFGHAPDYALGNVDADLLVAGHTHGGQVHLPFLGPIVTFSRVPRSWAAGVTDLGDGRTLVVSRGIGMERAEAPRVRFRCRPEVVVIDLVPRS